MQPACCCCATVQQPACGTTAIHTRRGTHHTHNDPVWRLAVVQARGIYAHALNNAGRLPAAHSDAQVQGRKLQQKPTRAMLQRSAQQHTGQQPASCSCSSSSSMLAGAAGAWQQYAWLQAAASEPASSRHSCRDVPRCAALFAALLQTQPPLATMQRPLLTQTIHKPTIMDALQPQLHAQHVNYCTPPTPPC